MQTLCFRKKHAKGVCIFCNTTQKGRLETAVSPKASSLAAMEAARPEIDEENSFSPKLEVLIRSPNGLIKCPVSSETQDDAISIRGRITVSF